VAPEVSASLAVFKFEISSAIAVYGQTGRLSPMRKATSIFGEQTIRLTLPPSRWRKIENYAVRFGPIASNCAFCSSLSVA
jgi:hypothetical protein